MTKCKLCNERDVKKDTRGNDLWYCETCQKERWQVYGRKTKLTLIGERHEAALLRRKAKQHD